MSCVFKVVGSLKGFDQLMNLVLDDVKEVMRGMLFSTPPSIPHQYSTPHKVGTDRANTMWVHTDDDGNEQTRELGLVVARGPLLVLISPVDGSEVIENPFAVTEEE